MLQLSLNETYLELHNLMDQYEDIGRIKRATEYYKEKVKKANSEERNRQDEDSQ